MLTIPASPAVQSEDPTKRLFWSIYPPHVQLDLLAQAWKLVAQGKA